MIVKLFALSEHGGGVFYLSQCQSCGQTSHKTRDRTQAVREDRAHRCQEAQKPLDKGNPPN